MHAPTSRNSPTSASAPQTSASSVTTTAATPDPAAPATAPHMPWGRRTSRGVACGTPPKSPVPTPPPAPLCSPPWAAPGPRSDTGPVACGDWLGVDDGLVGVPVWACGGALGPPADPGAPVGVGSVTPGLRRAPPELDGVGVAKSWGAGVVSPTAGAGGAVGDPGDGAAGVVLVGRLGGGGDVAPVGPAPPLDVGGAVALGGGDGGAVGDGEVSVGEGDDEVTVLGLVDGEEGAEGACVGAAVSLGGDDVGGGGGVEEEGAVVDVAAGVEGNGGGGVGEGVWVAVGEEGDGVSVDGGEGGDAGDVGAVVGPGGGTGPRGGTGCEALPPSTKSLAVALAHTGGVPAAWSATVWHCGEVLVAGVGTDPTHQAGGPGVGAEEGRRGAVHV